MSTVLWVALGGAAGSVARYGLAGALNDSSHPWGTVAVNVVGSFVLGLLIGVWGFSELDATRTGVTVGLLGGFTTFSTFSLDFVSLWENGRTGEAALMITISVAGGILAAFAGLAMGRRFVG